MTMFNLHDRVAVVTGAKQGMGKPEEVSVAVVFLASEEAGYITGTTLCVDGGWLAA